MCYQGTLLQQLGTNVYLDTKTTELPNRKQRTAGGARQLRPKTTTLDCSLRKSSLPRPSVSCTASLFKSPFKKVLEHSNGWLPTYNSKDVESTRMLHGYPLTPDSISAKFVNSKFASYPQTGPTSGLGRSLLPPYYVRQDFYLIRHLKGFALSLPTRLAVSSGLCSRIGTFRNLVFRVS